MPACGTCTTTGYDILGRVHTVTLPDGSIATTDYTNNIVTTTDPASKKSSGTNDGLGRLITVVENPGGTPTYTTSYVYDLLNNLRKVTQGAQTRFFNYDALSRLRRERNPEKGINTNLTGLTDSVTQNTQWSVEYVYNNNGSLTRKTDPRNVRVDIGYDALNRPITRTYSDSTPAVDYLYDGARVSEGIANSKGRITGALTTGTFASNYTYDSFDDLGRVLHTSQTTDAQPYQMSYQYNLAGLLTSETYPSNKTFTTAYDIAGRIAGVTGPSSKVYADSFTYAAHGGVAQMRLGNLLWEHANFNNRLQPTEIGIGTGQSGTASVDRLKLNYEYGATDNNGNVKNQTITVPTVSGVTGTTLNQCYTYDEFNRLKIAEEKTGATPCQGTTVWTQKFKYDQQSNRQFDTGTTIPVSLPNVTINTANNNRIDAGQGYFYDFAGNVTQDPSHTYGFDAEERQKTVDEGATGQYFYDGNGQRAKTITSSGTTIYVYDAMGRLVAEYTSGNSAGGSTSYITADGLGSPRAITAQDKSVKARHDYLPFGEEIPAGVGGRIAPQGYVLDTLRQKFTGKERDIESGLDYFGARYFSSAYGRFTSPDPMMASGRASLPQSWNRYSYVLNNPLRFIDSTGLEDEASEDKKRRKAVVVIIGGGPALSDAPANQSAQAVPSGGSTAGLGEANLADYEAQAIANQVKNDYPEAEVILSGPNGVNAIVNDLIQNPPESILIYGYSMGATSGLGVANVLTNNGIKVDQLTTVDPPGMSLGKWITTAIRLLSPSEAGSAISDIGKSRGVFSSTSLSNPSMVGDALNYVGPLGNSVRGARNEAISEGMKVSPDSNPGVHKHAEDITSSRAVQRLESRLSQVFNRPQKR